jgi:hypothetical protein
MIKQFTHDAACLWLSDLLNPQNGRIDDWHPRFVQSAGRYRAMRNHRTLFLRWIWCECTK